MSAIQDRQTGAAAQARAYRDVRALTERLAEPLSAEDQTVQSMPDCSPTKWHRAHTSWFFETFLLGEHLPGYAAFDPAYAYLFNSYYETVGPRHPRPQRGLLTRPGIAEIAAYRRHVDAAMLELLDEPPDEAREALVELGLHHEQQHQELLLMDAKHLLSLNPLQPAYRAHPLAAGRGASAPAERAWVEHAGGLAEIGYAGEGFCFDNETPRHTVHLEPFSLAVLPVSNGEWQAFIDDGGYQRPELWLSEGWATVNAQGWNAPLYWDQDGDGWTVFTLSGRWQVEPAAPVCHVSYYEADAFARWTGARLPTEFEWEAVAAGQPVEGAFLDTEVLHPRPAAPATSARPTVATGSPGAVVRTTTARPAQLFGDVWEWTASAYLPYPGFHPAAGAVGEYNGKFMVGQHVLRGGCCVTPAGHLRATYRNFFPPGARWAFSGLRLARDL